MWKIAKAFLLPLSLALVLAGCSEDKEPTPPSVPDVSVTLEASAEEISLGESLTLSWISKDAVSLQLFAGEIPIDLGDADREEGSVEVTPNRSLTYRLVGKGANGSSAEAEAKVVVTMLDPPSILRFTATPDVFGQGETVTLGWETRDAESVSIVDGDGRRIDTANASAREGSVSLQPKVSTTYELVAASRMGTARETVSIELVAKPTAKIWFDESPLDVGRTASVHWETRGATEARLVVEGSDEVLSTQLEGAVEIAPELTTTYRIEATGDGGEAFASRTIEIVPAVTTLTVDAAGAMRPGSLVELSWTILGGTTAVLTNEAGWRHTIEGDQVESGSFLAPVGKGGLFVLVAMSGEQRSRPRSVSVPLTAAPRILEAKVGPVDGVTAGRGERDSIELSWLVEGADRPLELERIPGGPINLVEYSLRSDSISFEVDGPTELRLVATNEAGRHEVVVSAPVIQPALIHSLTATPKRVGAGETVSIHWSTEDAWAVRLERDGVVLPVEPGDVNGSFEDSIAVDASYVLYATNALGFEVASRVLDVEIGAPIILDFGPVLSTVQPGDTLEFRWENRGGSSLSVVRDGGEVVCSTAVLSEVAQGSCFVPAGVDVGTQSYTLKVQNGAGSEEERRSVRITTGPVIASFTVDLPYVVSGSPLSFGWEVRTGQDDELPSLQLVDDLGRSYDLSAREVARDTKSFSIEGVGMRTFTLTATAALPEDNVQEELRIEVISLPRISDLQATPEFVGLDGEEVVVSWSSEDAASIEIFLVDASGLAQGQASCTITHPSAVAQGSCSIYPTSASPNVRVVATHSTGAKVSEELRVGVRPARITRFEPEHYDVLRGEGTRIHWETVWSDDRQIGPRFIEHDEPMIDLMAMSGASDIFNGSYDYSSYTFPEGFVFPYFGKEITNACVSAQGGLNLTASYCVISTGSGGTGGYPHGASGWDSEFHIGPFLSEMLERPYVERFNPDRSIWAGLVTDPETGMRSLAFQWRHIAYNEYYAQYAGMDLTFQLILHEDGTMDFRYGDMICPSEACKSTIDAVDLANGAVATIGYQDFDSTAQWEGNFLNLFPPNTSVAGGLSNRSFTLFPAQVRYARFVEEEGSMLVAPDRSRDFTLLVKNGYSSDERTFHLVVHEPGVLDVPFAEPAEPQPGMPVELHWSGSELTHLTILDRDGAIVFETRDEAELTSGVYLFTEGLSRGDHRFTFRAVGHIPRDVIEREVEVLVYEAYSLDSFTTNQEYYLPGEPVTLSWAGVGLTSISIESSRDPVVLPPGADPNDDSITIHPSKATLYTLHAESHGRKVSLQTYASIRTVRIDEVELSTGAIPAGGSMDLSWTSSGGGMVTITQLPATTGVTDIYTIPGTEFVEVTNNPSKRFVDLSEAGGSLLEGMDRSPYAATINFPEGFTFPWFGDVKNAIRVAGNGFLSWNLSESNTAYAAAKYPTGNASAGSRAFLPFWQTIQTTAPGSVWWKHDPAEGSLTIQWKDWQSNTAAARPTTFNFQVVLFEDGSFEYRYGDMAANNMAYANGQTVTNIGWQNPTAKIGATLSAANQPVPPQDEAGSPGPANRSFRVEGFPASGTATLRPTAKTEFEICINDDSWRECQTRLVNVLTAGQLMFTELMVNPSGGPSEQWFELRNLSGADLDMRGMFLDFFPASGAATRIKIEAADPVIIPGMGGYKVFAASALPGIDAYVYGEGIVLRNSGAGRRILLYSSNGSTAIADLTWSWEFPASRSMEVNANRQVFGTVLAPNNNVSMWCESIGFGTPGELGPSCIASELYRVEAYSSLPFIDLEGTSSSTLPELVADAAVAQLPGGMPFAFPYFDANLSVGHPLWLSSNGFSQFAELTSDWPAVRTNFPTASTAAQKLLIDQGVIAPFWVDLVPGPGASFRHAVVTRGGQQVLVLQWTGYERKNLAGRATFQSQLWENGDIVFAYQELTGGTNYLGTATNVGIEKIDSGGGHLYSQARAQAGLNAGQSIHFERKP